MTYLRIALIVLDTALSVAAMCLSMKAMKLLKEMETDETED